MRNPFLSPLPKKPIRWQAGQAKGTVGIPALPPVVNSSNPAVMPGNPAAYFKDPRGRKPKQNISGSSVNIEERQPSLPSNISRAFSMAGKMSYGRENYYCENHSGWGSNLDMLAISHGAVGCSSFAQTTRLNLPGFIQGIECFTALDLCTNLLEADLEDGGDSKLITASQEAIELFPLSRGITILHEEPISLIDSNAKGIAKAHTKASGKLTISMSCSIAQISGWVLDVAASLKAAVKVFPKARTTSFDVAIPFFRPATALIWIVSKLLMDIGLNPVHERTFSSTSDMSRLSKCKLVVGFADYLNVPTNHSVDGNAQLLGRWFGIPLVWASFLGPSSTDASLRMIASYFGLDIQRRAEAVIAVNRKKIDAIVAYYRPRLEGKLVIDFSSMPEAQIECYKLLGMRMGNSGGWEGKTGVWRKPRLNCDMNNLSEKSIDSYIEEAKPDLVFYFERHEYDWQKRGQPALPFNAFFDHRGDSYWGYDGFALLAAALDRAINAPWKKLVKPPWPGASIQ